MRNLIGEDDDSGDSSNAKIQFFAEAGNTYLVKLRGFSESETGSFRIWTIIDVLSKPVELGFGSRVSGILNQEDEIWYSVYAASEGFVTVETSGNLDTFLEAHSSAYKLIMEDDDSGEDQNAMIELWAEAGKTYLFKLRGYNSEESGPYQIAAYFEPIPRDLDRNTERSRALTIRLGESFSGLFYTDIESRWFRYDVQRPDTMLMVQTRGNLDTYMTFYDAQENVIAEDDDSGENLNAMISQRLPTGTVFIEVREYGGKMGRFTLHAETR